jgi:hypothetical protein
MNNKDLKAPSSAFKKEIEKKLQLKKMFFERTSRPRAEQNVINPKLKGI